jgi:hypothetical protein
MRRHLGKMCGLFQRLKPQVTTNTMFGTPARTTIKDESVFFVPLNKRIPINAEFRVTASGVDADSSSTPQFRALQDIILKELTTHKTLFRNPPSLESLQAITPNWGTIQSPAGTVWNPFMEIVVNVDPSQAPAVVDLVCEGVYISRSTIRPRFVTEFKRAENVIDFEWEGLSVPRDELEEVSDISSAAEGSIAIKDPVTMAREKAAAKEAVRAAFQAAESAREQAEDLATRFLANYDLSDSESAFSEWMSDDEDS